ncbi:MAG: MASE1 domain-containing protein, partial [Planctomycetes bacterium]|nr:MASE1 domain-containing protein [Planctomycetota bacterium]
MKTQDFTNPESVELRLTPWARGTIAVVIGALGYFLGYWLSTTFREESLVSAFWPAAGIGLSLVVLLGRGALLGVIFGSFAASMVIAGRPISFSAINATGTFLTLGSAILLMGANGYFDDARSRVGRLMTFFWVSAACAIIAAAFGHLALWVANLREFSDASLSSVFESIARWWLGDVLGLIAIVPVVSAWRTYRATPQSRGTLAENVIVVVAVGALSYLVFHTGALETLSADPLAFLLFPFLIIAALRYGERTNATLLFVLTLVVAFASLKGQGPFSNGDKALQERLGWTFALFLVSAHLVSLTICAARTGT